MQRTFVIAALLCCGAAQCVTAQIQQLPNGGVINLGELLNRTDRRFQVFDKIFNIESFTSNQFNPALISVVGFYHPTNPFEFGFDLTGGFGDASPGDGIIHEFNIQYTVEIAPDYYANGWRITDNHLLFNGNATGAPGSYARVDETVIDAFTGAPLGQKSVYDIVRDGQPNDTQLFDELIFSPRRILEINKDVKFLAATLDSTASASFVRQSFSQIPSPGACALIGLGGLVAFRRRR